MMPHPRNGARYAFVYGTLRSGGSNDIARYAPAPVRVADGRVVATLYDLGAYPGAVLGGIGEVRGEIYEIGPELEAQLDVLEDVEPRGSGEYIKREVMVNADGAQFPCLFYEIDPARLAGKAVIASGDWFDAVGSRRPFSRA